MITTTDQNPCSACGGRGYQHNTLTGINEMCPACGGSCIKYAGPGVVCGDTYSIC